MPTRSVASLFLAMFLFTGQASARDTNHLLPIQEALQSELGEQKLLDVPIYFAGKDHPPIATTIGRRKTNKSTRGIFRSDQEACRVAFLSAVIQLQKSAVDEEADAVVDIESITRHRPHSSPTEYRCSAGATVAHVGLRGTLVRLSE